jgi:hypothetical protein
MPFVRQKIDPALLDWVTKQAGSYRDEYGGDWAFDADRKAVFFFKGADALDPNLPRHYQLKVGADVFPVQILDSERAKTLPAGTAKIFIGPCFGAVTSRDVARQLAIEAYRCLHGSPTQNFQAVTSWGVARESGIQPAQALALSLATKARPTHRPVQAIIELYSPGQAMFAALLGGPLAVIYVLQKNFQELGNPTARRSTIRIGAVCMLMLLVVISFMSSRFFRSGFTMGVAFAASGLVKSLQMTKEAIQSSGAHQFQSNWNVVGVAILAAPAFVALLFFWAMLLVLFR